MAFKADSMPSDGKWTVTPTTTAALQDQDPGAPAHQPGPLQRHRDRRVDERVGRRVGTRLGLPQSDADARRLRLRRGLGPGAGRGRGHRPSSARPARRAPGGRSGRRGAGPLRNAAPPRRSVRARHVRPDRPGAPRPTPAGAGRSEAQARPGHRRVPVRLLPDDVRRRAPAEDQRLRRHLHPQPRRFGCLAAGNVHHVEQRAGRPAHPHRPEGPGLHVRDPDRPDTAGLRPGAAAQHRQDPHLGDRRHLARRRLLRGRGLERPRLHHAREQRPPAQRGPGRVHRLRQVGRQRHPAAEPAALHACRAPTRPPWRSTRTAT